MACDPVHTEVGRLPRPARLGAAHACGNKLKHRHQCYGLGASGQTRRPHLRLRITSSSDPAPHAPPPTPGRHVCACASCSRQAPRGTSLRLRVMFLLDPRGTRLHLCLRVIFSPDPRDTSAPAPHHSCSARSALACSLTPSQGPHTDSHGWKRVFHLLV